MKMVYLNINGIEVYRENGHLLLQKDDVKMRCDVGELNSAIEEFGEYYNRKKGLLC